MEVKTENDVSVIEYQETGRKFLKATEPITSYFWNIRSRAYKDEKPNHQPVIAPKSIKGDERLYVVSSRKFPGWIQTSDRYVWDGQGIAIARYEDTSKVKNRNNLVRCTLNPNKFFDTHFVTIPDEILLISFSPFKFRIKNNESRDKYNLVSGIGIATYTKDHVKKWITDEKSPWLDLSSGIANPYKPYADTWGRNKQNGQNMIRDAQGVVVQDLNWPVILYQPNQDGQDPFSWFTIRNAYKLPNELPKTITWHTPEIKEITEKWLMPFASGIREVPQDQL